MNVLVIGGSGLLGLKLNEILEQYDYKVTSTYFKNPVKMDNFFQLDITRQVAINDILKTTNPDVVILTAAYTDVDGCEKNHSWAFDINVKGTINVSKAVERFHTKLIYISTDYVFDGEKGIYKEEDPVNPINYYGKTKLEGEKAVTKICSDYIIARTSVVYGCNKNNFALWVIDKLKRHYEIKIVTDQFVSPTLNTDLAEQIAVLIDNDKKGIFHTAGGERINRYDFVNTIADMFGFDKDLISPIKMMDMSWIARRCRDSSLDVSRISVIKKPFKVREAVGLLQDELGRLK